MSTNHVTVKLAADPAQTKHATNAAVLRARPTMQIRTG